MSITRYFNLYLNAGTSTPLVINANQYDQGETWIFTLYTEQGVQYTPSSGAIVGIKSDGFIIANAGTVNGSGQVVITETQQMTAAAGKATFELQLDSETHGTANFIVLVEKDPSDGGTVSGSDIGLLREALNGGMSQNAVNALLDCFANVAWATDNGQSYYDALEEALKPPVHATAISLDTNSIAWQATGQTQQLTATLTPAESTDTVSWSSSNTSVATVSDTGLVTGVALGSATITATAGNVSATCSVLISAVTVTSISAVYTQSETVYDTDSLDSLKSDLVVTATWSDSSTSTVASSDYSLSGTLTVGTSTITVSYGGETTTFTVTVTQHTINAWYYPFNGSLLSDGAKEFDFTGTENYTTGRGGVEQAYFHEATGESASDPLGIKATGLTDYPDFTGEFTIAFWYASQTDRRGHPFQYAKYVATTNPSNAFQSSITSAGGGWTVTGSERASRKYCGITMWWYNASVLYLAMHSSESSPSASTQFTLTPPSGFDSTAWHHYAITRSGTSYYLFVDGVLQATITSSRNIYNAKQISIGNLFGQTSGTITTLSGTAYGDKIQDLYIANECKWTSDFDPTTIIY